MSYKEQKIWQQVEYILYNQVKEDNLISLEAVIKETIKKQLEEMFDYVDYLISEQPNEIVLFNPLENDVFVEYPNFCTIQDQYEAFIGVLK